MTKQLTTYFIGLVLAFLCSATFLPAQLGEWSHRMPILIDNSSGPVFAAGAYRITVDTQTPIGQGLMAPDGRDIRIADSCGTVSIPFWIEKALNTDSTVIWLRLPALLIGDSLQLFLYHGQPTAATRSNFNSTFPNAYQSQGSNDTLSGILTYDWFEIEAGDTLFLNSGAVLNLRAAKVIFDGTVMGDGAGYAAPSALSQPGNGPGAGQTSFNAGAGGGGYGGAGGLGGYDFADSPGAGGAAYGTRTGVDLALGSSGASSPIRMGGAGGGAIIAKGLEIEVGGSVFCRGKAAQQPGGAQGAGGGAGGGIYLQSRRLVLTGGLFATGGAGSVGLTSGNDDGGGGGGGRIKMFWEEVFDNQGNAKADGGSGGPNGSFAGGEKGADGSVLDTMQVYAAPYFMTSPSVVSPLQDDPTLVPQPDPVCEGEPTSFAMPAGYDNFQFYLNGQLQQDSSLGNYAPGILSTGDVVVVKAAVGACLLSDTLVIQTAPAPLVNIVASDSPACLGDTIFLNVGGGWNSVNWNTGDSGQVYGAHFSGVFIATVTDANQCTARDTYTVNLGAVPFPNISVSGLPACSGDPVSLTTTQPFSGYQWSNGATGPGTVVFNSGVITVTVTGTNGCSNSTSENIVYDTLPFPLIYQQNDTLFTQSGYAAYQWLWSGSALTGANTYYYVPTFNGNHAVRVEGINGCEGTSSATYIVVGREEPEPDYMQLVPNPGRGIFRLEGRWPEPSPPELLLYNATGTLVSRYQPEDSRALSMELIGLKAGCYWLIIRGERHVEREKVIVLE